MSALPRPSTIELDRPSRPDAPRSIGEILAEERGLLAQECVDLVTSLSARVGREAALRDPRVRTATRRYRMFTGDSA